MNQWTESQFTEAYRLYETGCVAEAFELFQKGANAGDASCMIWVGVLYGDNVKEDKENKNEIFWYKKAWEKQELSAANNLAIVYKNQKNYREAEHWFKVAIQNGDGDAHLELAKMYISTNQANDKAIEHLQLAINSSYITEQSIEEARELINKIA